MLNFPVKRQDEVNARKRYKIFGIGEAVDLLFLPLGSVSSFLYGAGVTSAQYHKTFLWGEFPLKA